MKRSAAGAFAVAAAVLSSGCVAPTQSVAAPPPPRPVAPAVEPPPPIKASAPGITISGTATQGGLLLGSVTRGTMNLTLDGQGVRVAPDGRFVVAFGQEAGPRSVLRATMRDGSATELPLTVTPRSWRVETIASVPRFAQPSAEFARLRPPELAAINAARSIDGGTDGWRQKFIWPVTGRISGLFGSYRVYANGEKGAPHSGVDVARPAGTPVVAPADGVVILAADHPFTLEGNLLMIDHGMGVNSAFLHLSRIDVKVGDRVRQGQPVGAIGMTGRASGPHLHWSMKWLDRRIDPMPLAGPMPAGG